MAATGSIAILLVSLYNPTFLPFLGAMSVFLLGMGIVNPLGTAQALSPFGEKAGAASALLGFWQMMNAAIGVWLAATVSREAMFALSVVLAVFSLDRGRALHCGPSGLAREITLVFPRHDFVRDDIRIERVEILRAADAAQCETAGGDQIIPPRGVEPGAECR